MPKKMKDTKRTENKEARDTRKAYESTGTNERDSKKVRDDYDKGDKK